MVSFSKIDGIGALGCSFSFSTCGPVAASAHVSHRATADTRTTSASIVKQCGKGKYLLSDLLGAPLNVRIVVDSKRLQQVFVGRLRLVLVVPCQPTTVENRPGSNSKRTAVSGKVAVEPPTQHLGLQPLQTSTPQMLFQHTQATARHSGAIRLHRRRPGGGAGCGVRRGCCPGK